MAVAHSGSWPRSSLALSTFLLWPAWSVCPYLKGTTMLLVTWPKRKMVFSRSPIGQKPASKHMPSCTNAIFTWPCYAILNECSLWVQANAAIDWTTKGVVRKGGGVKPPSVHTHTVPLFLSKLQLANRHLHRQRKTKRLSKKRTTTTDIAKRQHILAQENKQPLIDKKIEERARRETACYTTHTKIARNATRGA